MGMGGGSSRKQRDTFSNFYLLIMVVWVFLVFQRNYPICLRSWKPYVKGKIAEERKREIKQFSPNQNTFSRTKHEKSSFQTRQNSKNCKMLNRIDMYVLTTRLSSKWWWILKDTTVSQKTNGFTFEMASLFSSILTDPYKVTTRREQNV